MIKYRVERGVVVLPRHLSPTAANMRVSAGEIFELDSSVKDRFLRRSILNGDVTIVPEPDAPPQLETQPEPATDQPVAAERVQKGPRK